MKQTGAGKETRRSKKSNDYITYRAWENLAADMKKRTSNITYHYDSFNPHIIVLVQPNLSSCFLLILK